MKTHAAARALGFTLIEALVAVFAIAVISVGLASIFASVGDTIERGRRVSAINQYAASIERTLRADFERMTRDGFLVIRNEYTGGPAGLPISEEALDTIRPRRIDEIVFFARGQFETARGPMDPQFRPRASEVRIYVGHGMQQLEGAAGFFRPIIDDPNADAELRLGVTSGITAANPNFYPGDWTLLRQATLMARPGVPFGSDPADDVDRRFADNELQLGLQPAADSIFRSIAWWGEPVDETAGYDDDYSAFSARFAEAPPTSPSGVVDIATETLADVKRRVTALYVRTPSGSGLQPVPTETEFALDLPPLAFTRRGERFPPSNTTGFASTTITPIAPAELYDLQRALIESGARTELLVPNNERISLVHAQHAWMADAMPGASNELTWDRPTPSGDPAFDSDTLLRPRPVVRGLPVRGGPVPSTGPADGGGGDPRFPARTRMRYEVTPPGYNAAVFGELGADEAAAQGGQFRLAALRADQQMVTTSQFIPRCTDFIVEWSFGERYTLAQFPGAPEGELIWYGAPRDAEPRTGYADGAAALRPVRARPAASEREIPGLTGPALDQPNPLLAPAQVRIGAGQRLLERHLRADLIIGGRPPYENVLGRIDDRRESRPWDYPTTFYFGYGDPRAVPVDDFVDSSGAVVENTGFDVNGDGYRDDLDGDGRYDDSWPWPRLIRVTMSFADPLDQTVEETFQYVFEVPGESGL